jgi:hypothetical protein
MAYLKEELIKHLSDEIVNITQTTITFRTKIAFFTWVGPFIILGALVVATKGSFAMPLNCLTILMIIVIGGCYLGISYVCSRIEQHSWDLCNQYRSVIFRVSKGDNIKNINKNELAAKNEDYPQTYMIAYVLIFISAVCITILLVNLSPKNQNGKTVNYDQNMKLIENSKPAAKK